MKKIASLSLLLLLSLTLAISLSACGDAQDAPPASGTDPENAATADGLPRGTGTALVVYSNSLTDGRGDWLRERAEQDGFKVQLVEGGAGELQNRLFAEKNSPVADITFGLNAIIWELLIAEDVLLPYVPSWAGEVTPGLNDPGGHYHATVKQAILLVYDKHQMSEGDAPSDWPDLWQKEEFHGIYEFQRSLGGGTTRNVIAGILCRFPDPGGELGVSETGWSEIAAYYANGVGSEESDLYVRFADSGSPVVIGQMWSSGIADRDKEYGTDTGFVIPDIGVPFAVEGVAIINGTKNVDEAQRFVEWFGSAQIQGEWAERFATLPANENALGRADEFSQYIATIKAQDIDWALVAENIDAWCEKIELTYMR